MGGYFATFGLISEERAEKTKVQSKITSFSHILQTFKTRCEMGVGLRNGGCEMGVGTVPDFCRLFLRNRSSVALLIGPMTRAKIDKIPTEQ